MDNETQKGWREEYRAIESRAAAEHWTWFRRQEAQEQMFERFVAAQETAFKERVLNDLEKSGFVIGVREGDGFKEYSRSEVLTRIERLSQ